MCLRIELSLILNDSVLSTLTQGVALVACIRDVRDSSLGQDIDILTGLCGFAQSLQKYDGMGLQSRPRSLHFV